MKAILLYFSATGNTALIAELIKRTLQDKGYNVSMINILRKQYKIELKNYDLVGIGFPVYDFKPPAMVRKFLSEIDFSGTSAFIFATYGMVWAADSIDRVRKLLKKKGARVVGAILIPMTHSYSFFMRKKFIRMLDEEDKDKIKEFVESMLSNMREIHAFHKLRTRVISKIIVPLALDSFIPNVKVLRNKCDSCGKCYRVCPTGAIVPDKEGKPRINKKLCNKCYLCIRACDRGTLTTRKRFIEGIVHLARTLSRDKALIIYKT